jgi:hypothetical protein
LTEEGADTTLLWNRPFFLEFCPLILEQETCALGYAHLEPKDQATLRGAVFARADAGCTTCPIGIDLSKVDLTVDLFADTLLANCQQTGRIIANVSGQYPAELMAFEDLWRFTLVNYNAGPGCLASALTGMLQTGAPFEWARLTEHLSPACEGGVQYVETIAGDISPDATPDP